MVLDEGSATLGVWLPLALTDIATMLLKIISMLSDGKSEIKLLERSQWLEAWALPMMSAAAREDEKEQAALAMLNAVKRLGKKFNEQQHTSDSGQGR